MRCGVEFVATNLKRKFFTPFSRGESAVWPYTGTGSPGIVPCSPSQQMYGVCHTGVAGISGMHTYAKEPPNFMFLLLFTTSTVSGYNDKGTLYLGPFLTVILVEVTVLCAYFVRIFCTSTST